MQSSGLIQRVRRASPPDSVIRLQDERSGGNGRPGLARSSAPRTHLSEDKLEQIREEAYQRAGTEVLTGQFNPAAYAKASLACRGREQDLENTYIEMRAISLFRQLKDDRERRSALPRLVVAQPQAPRIDISKPKSLKQLYSTLSVFVLHGSIVCGFLGTLLGITSRMNKFVDLSLLPKIGLVILLASVIPYILYSVVKRRLEFVSYIQVLALMASFAAFCSLGTAYLLVKQQPDWLTFEAPVEDADD